MSSAVLIDFEQIYQVRSKKFVSASKFDDIASGLKTVFRKIRAETPIFPPITNYLCLYLTLYLLYLF